MHLVDSPSKHDPDRAFTDGRPVSVGIHGRVGQRNAPTVLNALYNKHQFWDGRVSTLEQQAALPITNPFEMGSASIGDSVSRIASDKDYQAQFVQAFGRGENEQDMLSAPFSPSVSQISYANCKALKSLVTAIWPVTSAGTQIAVAAVGREADEFAGTRFGALPIDRPAGTPRHHPRARHSGEPRHPQPKARGALSLAVLAAADRCRAGRRARASGSGERD